jgi:hypothetical protein
MFKFMQPITCPHGPGHFIGYFRDGDECQITRWTMRNDKKICVNETYAIGQISARESTVKSKHQTAPVILDVDPAFV